MGEKELNKINEEWYQYASSLGFSSTDKGIAWGWFSIALGEAYKKGRENMKKEILAGLPKVGDWLQYDPGSKLRVGFVDGFNKCLSQVKNLLK